MSCPICLEIIEGNGYAVLHCGHSMHMTCFESFINSPLKCCPLCRSTDIPQINNNLKNEITSLKNERENLRYIISQNHIYNMRSQVDLSLKKFNMSLVKDDAVCVFIGRRRTGKSVAVQDLLYYKRDIPFGVCISGTEHASPFFQKFIPSTYIHNEFDEASVGELLQRQVEMKRRKMRDPGFNVDERLCLIMDDCLYDNEWARTKVMRNLFMNGRHFKILFILTMQYSMGIPPNLRGNIDYTFIMREPQYANRKRLFEQYATAFPDFAIFCQVLDQLDKYEMLVIDNNSDSNKLEDQVFWYKADIHDKFQFGSQAYWRYHNDNYKEDDDSTPFNVAKYKHKKNKTLIHLNKQDY